MRVAALSLVEGSRKGPLSCGLSEEEVHMRPNILFAAFLGALVLAAGQRDALAQGVMKRVLDVQAAVKS
jgi:hypothetical protein